MFNDTRFKFEEVVIRKSFKLVLRFPNSLILSLLLMQVFELLAHIATTVNFRKTPSQYMQLVNCLVNYSLIIGQ